jgi:hypothetical protein
MSVTNDRVYRTVNPSVRFPASSRGAAFVAPFPPVLGIGSEFSSTPPVPPGGGVEGSTSGATVGFL